MPPPKRRPARPSRQHSLVVDDELWDQATHIADHRREAVSDVLRRALVDYVAEHRDVLPTGD